MKELVFKGESNQVLTNSLLVAEKFGKEHSDVLKAIDVLVSKMPKNQCEGYFAYTSIEVKQPNGGVRHSRIVIQPSLPTCYTCNQQGCRRIQTRQKKTKTFP